jgi:hypothetical protein
MKMSGLGDVCNHRSQVKLHKSFGESPFSLTFPQATRNLHPV